MTSKAWTLIAEEAAISERCNHLCVAIGHDRFIVHGGDCMGPLSDAFVYSKASDTWTPISCPVDESPVARYAHSGCLWHSKAGAVFLVVFGGLTTDAVHLNDIWLLNVTSPDVNDWVWHQVQKKR